MDKKDLKYLSINEIDEVSDEISDEFFYAKICVLSTRPNSHKILITDEILRRDGKTILGKWVVANPNNREFMSHDTNEFIVGIIPMDSNIEYVVDDEGYTLMYVDAILSKIYSNQIYDMFKKENRRNVSVEMITDDLDKDEYGNIPIKSLKICGVTILGKFINGSCPDANMSVVKFSEEEATKFYDKFNKFANDEKVYKINKTELKENDWGDVDKISMRNKIMKAKNRDTLVKSVYAQVLEGWQDAPSENLKYPLMQLIDDTFYYNRGALSSALAYAKQHNDTDVINKVEKLYKKFKLNNDKEEKMAETKKFESEVKEDEKEIIMAEDEKEKAEQPQEEDKKEMAEDEVVMEDVESEKEVVEEKEMGCDTKEMEEQPKECADDKEEEVEEDEVEEKKFSLSSYLDVEATLFSLENESEQTKELVKTVMSMSANEIIDTVVKLSKENGELEQFKENRLAQDKTIKLSQIMSNVKEDLDTKTFSELQAEGEKLSFAELDGFENKVKAFAYEATKSKKQEEKDGIMKFAFGEEIKQKAELTADEIYKKYL